MTNTLIFRRNICNGPFSSIRKHTSAWYLIPYPYHSNSMPSKRHSDLIKVCKSLTREYVPTSTYWARLKSKFNRKELYKSTKSISYEHFKHFAYLPMKKQSFVRNSMSSSLMSIIQTRNEWTNSNARIFRFNWIKIIINIFFSKVHVKILIKNKNNQFYLQNFGPLRVYHC